MRLIDAETVYKDMKNKLVLKPEEFATRVHYIQSAALNCVAGAPTIEAKPVEHAHWEKQNYIDMYYTEVHCSSCEKRILAEYQKEYKYCPFCGSQMDEVVE